MSVTLGSSGFFAPLFGRRQFAKVCTLPSGGHCNRGDRGLMNIRRLARIAAWIGLALIVFVTIAPIDVRPSDVTTADLDRALAFVVMSFLFIIAYPRRVLVISLLLFIAAFLIELTQLAAATRHPQMHDAVIKALGVIVGVSGGLIINLLLRRNAGGEGSNTL